jgi:hypothetical protein
MATLPFTSQQLIEKFVHTRDERETLARIERDVFKVNCTKFENKIANLVSLLYI